MSLDIKKMAEALRSGATMMIEACPQCNSPLIKMPSTEIYCFKCNQKVIIAKADENASGKTSPQKLTQLEDTLFEKLQLLEEKIKPEKDLENLQPLMMLVLNCLTSIETLRKIRDTIIN